MRFIRSAIFIIAVVIFPTLSMFAQENEPQVVDEVVAQVNDGVITLSQVNREIKNAIESLVEQKKMTPEAAKAEIESKRGEIIANLINEELIMQKGKESNIDSEVEAEVNRQLIAMMKDNNLKTLEALYTEMRKVNVNPDDVRESFRRRYTRDMVMSNEVDRKVYAGWAPSEIKAYYEKNKEKLIKPESYSLSEIFLNFAGRDKDALKAKAFDIVSKARNGADFGQLAVENSDRPEAKNDKGKISKSITIEEIKGENASLAASIQATKVGGITDPIISEEGIEIFKVDDKKAPSNEFDESMVRNVMTVEKIPDERRKFLADLRKEGFVKVSKEYEDLVKPFFSKDEVTAEISKDKPEAKKPETKKKN